jgi:UPF0042 nucleotide-binding protein
VNTNTNTVTVVTGGELHPWPGSTPDITFNLSRLLHDPARIPTGEMLDKTGLDPEVSAFVFDSDEALELLDAAIELLLTPAKPVLVAVLCRGGRHRSVAFAERLTQALVESGVDAGRPTHFHIHLPRVIKGKAE